MRRCIMKAIAAAACAMATICVHAVADTAERPFASWKNIRPARGVYSASPRRALRVPMIRSGGYGAAGPGTHRTEPSRATTR